MYLRLTEITGSQFEDKKKLNQVATPIACHPKRGCGDGKQIDSLLLHCLSLKQTNLKSRISNTCVE